MKMHCAFLMIGLMSASAHASPVTWTFENANVSGSYSYDADTNTLLSWSLTDASEGKEFDTMDSSSSNVTSTGFLLGEGGGVYLYLTLDGTMTDAGGTLVVDQGNPFTGSYVQTGYGLLNSTDHPINGDLTTAATPEPGGVVLSGTALVLGGAWMGLRRRRVA